MTRFNIAGDYLDMPADFSLQLTKKNPLFAFDDLSCERSVSFGIPDTPNNNRIFAFSKMPVLNGNGMRHKYAAQMQDGAVIRDGYLYVTSYESGKYNCVFVFGNLLNVKDFDNSKFGDIYYADPITGTVVDSDINNSPLVGYVRYHNDKDNETISVIRPSVDIQELFEQINSQGLLSIQGLENVKMRIIRDSEFKYKYDRVLERLQNDGDESTQTDMALSTVYGIVEPGRMVTYDDRDPEGVGHYDETNCFVMVPGSTKIYITFPADTPEDLCLVYPIYETGYDYTKVGFLGTRHFERPEYAGGDVIHTGTPLAGQTIEIDPNQYGDDKFMLMTGNGTPYSHSEDIDFYEIDFSVEPSYDVRVRISSDELPFGLNQQLPVVTGLMDLSLGDLLKMYAARVGKLLGTTSAGAVKFIDVLNLTYIYPDVISRKQLTRTFSDYAQENTVQFEKSENVLDEEKISFAYTIDNDNIEAKKDLLTLAAIEGGKYEDGDLLLVRGIKQTGYNYETPDNVLSEMVEDETYLARTTLQKSTLMQNICGSSTTLKVTVYMSLLDFVLLDSEKGVCIDGVSYIWVDAQWQKNTATLTLAKL